MANTGYGRGPYGVHRYGGWPGGAGRPYGIGAYGTGLYSRYGANVFAMGGHSGILFTLQAALRRKLQMHMASSIVFDASALGMARISNAYAATQIVFTTHTHLTWTWQATDVCRTGSWTAIVPIEALWTWQATDVCKAGSWTATDVCKTGTWTATVPMEAV